MVAREAHRKTVVIHAVHLPEDSSVLEQRRWEKLFALPPSQTPRVHQQECGEAVYGCCKFELQRHVRLNINAINFCTH